MSRGLNKVMLIGHLGADPEVRFMPGGGCVANNSLATNEAWKDRTTGENKERTEWHRVVFFNRLGEIIKDYTRKGSRLYVEGRLQTRKWQDKDGQDRYTTEIIATDMQMLDSRGNGPDFDGMPEQGSASAAPTQATSAAPAPAMMDDDVPF